MNASINDSSNVQLRMTHQISFHFFQGRVFCVTIQVILLCQTTSKESQKEEFAKI